MYRVSDIQIRNVEADALRDLGGQARHLHLVQQLLQNTALGTDAGRYAFGFHSDVHNDFLGERDPVEVHVEEMPVDGVVLKVLHDGGVRGSLIPVAQNQVQQRIPTVLLQDG